PAGAALRPAVFDRSRDHLVRPTARRRALGLPAVPTAAPGGRPGGCRAERAVAGRPRVVHLLGRRLGLGPALPAPDPAAGAAPAGGVLEGSPTPARGLRERGAWRTRPG